MKKLQLNNIFKFFGVLILLIIAVVYHLSTLNQYHNWGPDFATYVGQAIGIVDGFEYLELFRVGEDLHVYPWGFPTLLAPIYAIWGFNLQALKIFVTSFFFLSLPMIFVLFADRLSYISKYVIVVFLVLNPFHNYFKNNILSDFPFLFFSLLSIYLIQYFYVDGKKLFKHKSFDSILLGIVLVFTYQIRTQGIVLVPILLLAQYIYLRKKKSCAQSIGKESILVHLIPLGLFVLVTYLINLLITTGDGSYLLLLRERINISWIIANIKYYLFLPIDYLRDRKITTMLYGLSLYFFIKGGISRIKDDYIYLLYMLGSIGLLILWPFQQGPRFILSVVPYYLYFLFVGLEDVSLGGRFPLVEKYQKIYSPLLAGVLVLMLFGPDFIDAYSFVGGNQGHRDGPYSLESQEMFEYIIRETDTDAVFMFRKSPIIPLYANRKAVHESINIDNVKLSAADYYIYHPTLSNNELMVEMDMRTNEYELVFENDMFKIYRLIYP